MKIPFSATALRNSGYEGVLMGLVIVTSAGVNTFLEEGRLPEAAICAGAGALLGLILILFKYEARVSDVEDKK